MARGNSASFESRTMTRTVKRHCCDMTAADGQGIDCSRSRENLSALRAPLAHTYLRLCRPRAQLPATVIGANPLIAFICHVQSMAPVRKA